MSYICMFVVLHESPELLQPVQLTVLVILYITNTRGYQGKRTSINPITVFSSHDCGSKWIHIFCKILI